MISKNTGIEYLIMLLQLPKIDRKTILKIYSDEDFKISSKNDFIKYVLANRRRLLLPEISTYVFNGVFNRVDQIIKGSDDAGIKMVSIFDSDYPRLLKTCFDAPIILNYKGNIDLLNRKPAVAVIGTREPTGLGQQCGEYFGRYFANLGFNVVSGLAKGCDTAAHTGALNANGITSAVLAHGLDMIYPKQNTTLAEQLLDTGVLVSEYFVGEKPKPQYFIQRDRIQAGLSLGTLVIETAIKGGTMHTANHCLQYKRVLACLNPPIECYDLSKFEGNRLLIHKNGAKPIYSMVEVDELTKRLTPDY